MKNTRITSWLDFNKTGDRHENKRILFKGNVGVCDRGNIHRHCMGGYRAMERPV